MRLPTASGSKLAVAAVAAGASVAAAGACEEDMARRAGAEGGRYGLAIETPRLQAASAGVSKGGSENAAPHAGAGNGQLFLLGTAKLEIKDNAARMRRHAPAGATFWQLSFNSLAGKGDAGAGPAGPS